MVRKKGKMSVVFDRIKFIVAGSTVKRFHTMDTIKEETVGHHSFLVACLVIELGGSFLDTAKALYHDLPEQVTGDLPSPLKAGEGFSDTFKDLEEVMFESHYIPSVERGGKDWRILKIADILSGILYCIREKELGNSRIEIALNNYLSYLENFSPFTGKELVVVNSVLHIVGKELYNVS